MFLVTLTLLQKILLICVGQCLANLMDNHLKLLLYNLLTYFRWLDIWNGLLNLKDVKLKSFFYFFFKIFLYGKVKFKINLKKSSVKHSFSQYPIKDFIMSEILARSQILYLYHPVLCFEHLLAPAFFKPRLRTFKILALDFSELLLAPGGKSMGNII